MSRAWLSLLELLLASKIGFFPLAYRGWSLNIAPDSRLKITEAETYPVACLAIWQPNLFQHSLQQHYSHVLAPLTLEELFNFLIIQSKSRYGYHIMCVPDHDSR